MSSSSLARQSAVTLRESILRGGTTCRRVMEAVLAEIAAREGSVQAYLTLRDSADLLAEADAVDRRIAGGEPIGALAGLPVAIKDSICTRGLRTTCASKMLETFVPPYDATAVARIRAADGIILGKTNMDEFSMGASTESSAFKVTRNPHDLTRVPGGTSGGSAAAVAAHEAILALGSDTGGSIRQPAAFCGVVGFKPTYGQVSRYGLIAYASSFDQIGPLTRTVADCQLLFSVIRGHDPLDATSCDVPAAAATGGAAAGGGGTTGAPARIGVPKEYFSDALDPEVRRAVEQVVDTLARAGHPCVEVSLPSTDAAVAAYYTIVFAEASSNLARYDGVRYGYRAEAATLDEMYRKTRSEGFGPEVKRRIMLGTYILSAGYYDRYFDRAARVRRMIKAELDQAFTVCDVLVHPVAPTPAYPIGTVFQDPLAVYLGDVYSVTANLAGLPAISVPCGTTAAGLPIGVQIAGDRLTDDLVLATAARIEMLLRAP